MPSVPPGRVSPNELRRLLEEHGGSRERLLAARPDLAWWFEGVDRARSMLGAFDVKPVGAALQPDDVSGINHHPELEILADIRDAVTATAGGVAVPGGGDEFEPDPRSQPEAIGRALLWKVIGMLGEPDVQYVDIETATGLSARQVRKIRDYRDHPQELGPNGSPGYGLYPGDVPGTVLLRKLRKRRR